MNTVNVVGVAYDCRIQITIGKICPTSTGVRDNVVIVPLANSRKRKTRCGFSSLFRSLASISFNLLSACFFFFSFLFFLFYLNASNDHFISFICPIRNFLRMFTNLRLPRKYIFRRARFNSFCALGYLRFHCVRNNHLSFFFLFLPEKDRNIDGNHWYAGTSIEYLY